MLSDGLLRFARQYANWDGVTTVCLTLDVDFAPDYMLEHALAILDAHGTPATIFATHASPVLKAAAQSGRHEVGLHPNLAPNGSQGSGLAEMVGRLRAEYPGVVGNRFHLLAYSYRHLATLRASGLEYDVSTLRFNCPYLLPAWHRDLDLVLLTYAWEDGICENAGLPMRGHSVDLASPGLKILNFHPMNIYINGPDASARLTFLAENPSLPDCPRAVADRHRRTGDGAERVLTDVLRLATERGWRVLRLRDVVAAYLALVHDAEPAGAD